MLRLDVDVTVPQWIFINIFGGIGIGILLPVMSTCYPSPRILCPLFKLAPKTCISFMYSRNIPQVRKLTFSGLAVQASASDKDMAHAAAMTMTLRTLGMALSLAILGIIFQNVFEQKLRASSYRGPIQGLAQNVLGVVEVIKQLPNESSDKLILRQVFAESLKWIWATLRAFNGV
jgi:hypothetical protein